jgi:hypothetical protein
MESELKHKLLYRGVMRARCFPFKMEEHRFYVKVCRHSTHNRYSDETTLDLVFFSPFEDLRLQTSGTMETNGIRKLYEAPNADAVNLPLL